jgi:hypothetical protein
MQISLVFTTFISVHASFFDETEISPEVRVFNVSVTPSGLAIPFRNNSSEVVHVALNSQYYLGSMRLGEIALYPYIENIPQAQRPFVDGAPHPGYQQTPTLVAVAAQNGPQISIAQNSPISAHYRYAMLAPSREGGGFQLFAGLADPTEYCFEGVIASAQFGQPISFHVGTALIPNPSRPVSPLVAATANVESAFYDLDTSRHKDSIPGAVYDALVRELMILVAGTLNHTDVIPQMPSIQYTIYRSDSGAVAVSNIVLAPEDYVTLRPDGRFELQVESAELVPMLGINFLRNVAIHLNYAENRIGFCDPI